jgi:hypothetical protein
MEAQDKEKILAELQSGRKALLAVLTGLTEDAAARIPSAGKWSVLECVEHVAVSEDYLFSQIISSQLSDEPLRNTTREALILTRGLDRTIPALSPEVGKPAGRFATLSEALEHFLESRDRSIRFVEECVEDLRSKRTTHPIAGVVNCYEMLLIMAVHTRRHAKQIEEVRAALS